MARRASRKVSVDFTGVETGGGGFHIPEGLYPLRVETVKKGISSNDNEQFEWIFKGTGGKAKGKKFYFYTPLVEQALWKLRETLECLGLDVPDSALEVDLDELEGLEATGSVEDDEYRGKVRSKLVGLVNGEDAEEAEDEEEAPARHKAATAKGKKKATVKLSADEVKEMSEDELDSVVDKYDLGVDLGDYKTLGKKAAAVIEALGETGSLEEEDEEEEEETPTARRRKRR